MTAIRKKHVLVVEDDLDAAQELRALLESRGYSVETAENGRAALDMLLKDPTLEPALVVLDIGMPVMDGWELLAIMRSYFRLRNIPVVLITAHPVAPHSTQIVDGLFKKPFAPEELLGTVTAICGA
jgi:CheY-like chemotaxis protein